MASGKTPAPDTHARGLNIVYKVGGGLYLNLTNRCTCDCAFCLRNGHNAVGSADTLWLTREPSAEEVCAALDAYELWAYNELVFCGFGEPTMRLDVLLEAARHVKARCPELSVRVNTNGHASLLHGRDVAPELTGLVDVLSISLNYPDAAQYAEQCKPQFGEEAYAGLLDFARRAKIYVPKVILTVVDVLPPEAVNRCRDIAAELDVHFRVRTLID